MHIWIWDDWSAKTVPLNMVVGHEFCGEIVDAGPAATKFRIGQRVSGEGHVVCGTCRNCRAGRGHLCRNTLGVGVNRPGSFADYLCIPEDNVVPIPDDVPDEIAAIFDPFGNAVHTALSFDLVGEDVLITGAGPIGIMGALVAQKVGARKVVITDITPYRIDLARRMGVQHVVNAAEENLSDVMERIGMTEGFDVGLEMSGAAPAMRGPPLGAYGANSPRRVFRKRRKAGHHVGCPRSADGQTGLGCADAERARRGLVRGRRRWGFVAALVYDCSKA